MSRLCYRYAVLSADADGYLSAVMIGGDDWTHMCPNWPCVTIYRT